MSVNARSDNILLVREALTASGVSTYLVIVIMLSCNYIQRKYTKSIGAEQNWLVSFSFVLPNRSTRYYRQFPLHCINYRIIDAIDSAIFNDITARPRN